MSDAVGSIIQGGSQLTNTLVDNIYQSNQNAGNREHAYQMTDYIYSKDLEQWNRANDYNSPKSQMQRFTDAGLNPALMYSRGEAGQAASSGVQAHGSPSFNRTEIKNAVPDMVSIYQDYRLKQGQIDQVKATTDNIAAQTKLRRTELILKGLELGLKPFQIQFALREMNQKASEWPYDLQAKQQNVEKIKAETFAATERANLTALEKEKLQTWLDEYNSSGMNIDKDPYWLRMGIKAVQGTATWNDFMKTWERSKLPKSARGPGEIYWDESGE